MRMTIISRNIVHRLYLVESGAYVGADQLDTLANIKSREEMIADIVLMLQQAAGQKIAGLLKTMEEKKAEE